MKTLLQISDQNKPALAREIITLHNEITAAARLSLDKAVRIGELLMEGKSRLNHGQWLPWLKRNVPFSDRTARNYIRVYENRDRLKTESVSDLGDAYKLLAPPSPCESEPKTARQLIRAAMKEILDAGEMLEKEKMSTEYAGHVLEEVERIKTLAEGMISDLRNGEFFTELLCIITKCADWRYTLERRSANQP